MNEEDFTYDIPPPPTTPAPTDKANTNFTEVMNQVAQTRPDATDKRSNSNFTEVMDQVAQLLPGTAGDLARQVSEFSAANFTNVVDSQGHAPGEGSNYASKPAAASTGSNISNVIDRLVGAIGKDYEKNPIKYLGAALGTLGGVYKADETRKAADALARSRINELDRAAQIKAEEDDRQRRISGETFAYMGNRQKVGAAKPLTRLDGSRVFDNTGKRV